MVMKERKDEHIQRHDGHYNDDDDDDDDDNDDGDCDVMLTCISSSGSVIVVRGPFSCFSILSLASLRICSAVIWTGAGALFLTKTFLFISILPGICGLHA